MRAGLGKGGQAAVARFADLVERVLAGEMHDVDGHARHLRHGDGAMHGFSLGLRGPREGVVDGRGLSLGQRLLHDDIDDRAIFGMHANQRAVLGGLAHGLEDSGVVDHERIGIGHEELEAGHAFAHQVVHVFEAGVGQVGDDHVQAVVDAGFALGLLPPGVEGGAHLRSAGLDGEIDNRCGPADGSGPRAGLEVVGGCGAAEGHVEMSVRVDAAGQKQQAGCVDDGLRGRCGDAGADLLDDCAVDEDVGAHGGVGVDYGSVLDEECRHGRILFDQLRKRS